MCNKFNVYRYLVGTKIAFLEIRHEMSDNGQSSQITRWILVRGTPRNPCLLNLCFRDSLANVEELYFEEGYLKINGKNGAYIEKFNSAQYQMELSEPQFICLELLQKIDLLLMEAPC